MAKLQEQEATLKQQFEALHRAKLARLEGIQTKEWNELSKLIYGSPQEKIDIQKAKRQIPVKQKEIQNELHRINHTSLNKTLATLKEELRSQQQFIDMCTEKLESMEKRLQEIAPSFVFQKEEERQLVSVDDLIHPPKIDWNLDKAMGIQKLAALPFFDEKLLWKSIIEKDDFYKNTLLPMIKLAAALLTPTRAAAHALCQKWEEKLTLLGKLWKESGSEKAPNLSSINFFQVLKVLFFINHYFTLFTQMPTNTKLLLNHLGNLDIPDTLDIHLQQNEEATIQLLDTYLQHPETDLASLFQEGSKMQSWPKDCQFLLALALLGIQKQMERYKDSNFRSKSLYLMERDIKSTPPSWITDLLSSATLSPMLFNGALDIALKMIPAPPSETEFLQEKLANAKEKKKGLIQEAIKFASTPKRKEFDKALCSFGEELTQEVITLVRSKNTSEDKELGTMGKEFNIQSIIVDFINLPNETIKLVQARKEYLEALNSKAKDLKAKKERLDELEGKNLSIQLKLLKKASQIPLRNSNIRILLNTIDQKILPNIKSNPSVNLSTTPFFAWLQNSLILPLSKGV